eukprot:XP_025005056.1 uncharacterized protein LOC112532150 [Gallus gallus]
MCHLDDIFQFLFWYRCVFMSVLCVLEITLFGETITRLCASLFLISSHYLQISTENILRTALYIKASSVQMTIRIRRQLGNVDNGTDGTAAEFKFHFIAVSTENTDFRERKKKKKKKKGGGGREKKKKKKKKEREEKVVFFCETPSISLPEKRNGAPFQTSELSPPPAEPRGRARGSALEAARSFPPFPRGSARGRPRRGRSAAGPVPAAPSGRGAARSASPRRSTSRRGQRAPGPAESSPRFASARGAEGAMAAGARPPARSLATAMLGQRGSARRARTHIRVREERRKKKKKKKKKFHLNPNKKLPT